jgi:hypothetical protein
MKFSFVVLLILAVVLICWFIDFVVIYDLVNFYKNNLLLIYDFDFWMLFLLSVLLLIYCFMVLSLFYSWMLLNEQVCAYLVYKF